MSYQDDIQRLHNLSQRDLDEMMTSTAQGRARTYQREHRVFNRRVYQNTLYAQVRGSEPEPYQVEISVQDGEVYGYCTCPYELNGWCKHIGAVAMEWIDNPDRFQVLDKCPESYFEQLSDQEEEEEEEEEMATQPKTTLSTWDSFNNLPSEREAYVQEIKSLLQNYTIEQLRQLARNCQFNLNTTRKEKIIETLSYQLSDPAYVEAQLGQLDNTSLRILIFMNLVAPPGYGSQSSILRPFGMSGQENRVVQCLEKMTHHGLLFTFELGKTPYFVLPQVVRASLPLLPDAVAAWPEKELAQTEIKHQEFTSIVPRLYRMWSFLHETHPRRAMPLPIDKIETELEFLKGWRNDPDEVAQIRKNRYSLNVAISLNVSPAPPYLEPDVQQALSSLLGADVQEIEFYYALLMQMEAVRGNAGEPIQTELSPLQELSTFDVGTQLTLLAIIWSSLDNWSEVDMVLRSKPEICVRRNSGYISYKMENLYQEWREGRMALVRFLSLLPENKWISVEAFLRTVYEVLPNILHMSSESGVWWLESTHKKKQFGTSFEDWLTGYGQLILAILTGPLRWFGMIELAYRQDQPVAMRLTPIGAFTLGRKTSIDVTSHRAGLKPEQIVHFNDDLTVELASGIALPELYTLLNQIGRLENITTQTLIYRLDAGGVQRCLEQGDTAANLIDRLSQLSGKPLSEAWQRRLHEWENNYGRLHLYQDIALVELTDDLALHELLAATSLRNHLIYRFSNRLIAIRSDAIDELTQEMEKRGYMPHVTG